MRDENSAVKYTNTLLPSDIYASAHYFSCDRLGLQADRHRTEICLFTEIYLPSK